MTRKLILPSIVALIMLAVLMSLGVWQLNRKVWKEALISEVEERAKGAPVDLKDLPPEWRDARTVETANFARVAATGRFDHRRELRLIAPQRNGAGWMIVTRFDTPQGAVLIMRGVVPDNLRDPSTRAAGQVEDEIRIVGRIRVGEQSGAFTPANDANRNNWFWRDLVGMKHATGVDEAGKSLPFFIELEQPVPPGGWPRPQLDEINLRNDHLQYAITWFALAAVLIGMFAIWFVGQRRAERSAQATTDG